MNAVIFHVCALLGSNVQPEVNLPRAVGLLQQRLKIEGVSSVWETRAVDSAGPNFLNVAVLINTRITPLILKNQLFRPLEAMLGRVRVADKNAPRPIDVDIVVWAGRVVDKEVWQYAHMAVPVAELLPNLRPHPLGESLAQVAKTLSVSSVIWERPDVARQMALVFSASVRGSSFKKWVLSPSS